MSDVRVCENCKFRNNINNLECEKCGYDLSFVIPINESEVPIETTTLQAAENTKTVSASKKGCGLVLVSADKQLIIPIENGLVIGRDGFNGSYFERSNFVSRKHAIFYIENDKTLIFDASTNGTFINGKKLDKLTKIIIQPSDKITFADITFEVENAD